MDVKATRDEYMIHSLFPTMAFMKMMEDFLAISYTVLEDGFGRHTYTPTTDTHDIL